jgi:acetoin utilization deacetylase AcuC-like enzyme
VSAIKVFYSEKMVAPQQTGSPSAHKPAEVVKSWQALGLPLEVISPAPVTEADLCLAHDPRFVRGVLSGQLENGFHNTSVEVAKSTLYTNSAMLAAAREALTSRRVAVAPCSGFHHACFGHSGGFCTFNGLMVTALKLKHEERIRRIGILDFDQHFGNGTADLIERHAATTWVRHFTAGTHYTRPEQANEFLTRIPTLALVRAMQDCDLVLYQAGADPHIDDPLGGWLTTEQLRLRDRLVFETAATLGIPIAWTLAGAGSRHPRQHHAGMCDRLLSMTTGSNSPCQ